MEFVQGREGPGICKRTDDPVFINWTDCSRQDNYYDCTLRMRDRCFFDPRRAEGDRCYTKPDPLDPALECEVWSGDRQRCQMNGGPDYAFKQGLGCFLDPSNDDVVEDPCAQYNGNKAGCNGEAPTCKYKRGTCHWRANPNKPEPSGPATDAPDCPHYEAKIGFKGTKRTVEGLAAGSTGEQACECRAACEAEGDTYWYYTAGLNQQTGAINFSKCVCYGGRKVKAKKVQGGASTARLKYYGGAFTRKLNAKISKKL